MKKTRKIIMAGMLIIGCLGLTGCGLKAEMKVDVDGKKVTQIEKVYYSEAELSKAGSDMDASKMKTEMVNGKTYYVDEEKTVITSSNLAKNCIELDSHKFVFYTNPSESSMSGISFSPEFCEVKFTFTKKVLQSNGTISADGKTVVYQNMDVKEGKYYAVFDNRAAKSKSVMFSDAKNNKCYKTDKKIYLKSSGVITDIKINGKSVHNKAYWMSTNGAGKLYKDYVTLSKDGEYKIQATLSSGYKKSITVTVDKTKPKTSIKDGSTYKKKVKVLFTDKLSGIKKATLNGKKIKTGIVVRKSGEYRLVLIDKVGNVKKIKFAVK